MYAEFATKLRLTAAALGCDSRKALCARFRAVNANTQCEVERLHKWMQGRALPRGVSFYEDWRLVLGSAQPAAWFEESSVDAFIAELALLTGVPGDELRGRAGRQSRATIPAPGVLGAQQTFYGAFACYSHAWSPHFRGKLIRGSLRIRPGRGPWAQAVYCEELINGPCRLVGEVVQTGGMMHMVLRGSANGPPLLLTVIAPGPPVSALCGILAGSTFISHAPEPTATRFVAVRVADSPALDTTNRYMEPDAAAILQDLHAAGLRVPEPGRVGADLAEFLAGGPNQVTLVDQLLLCNTLDAAHFPVRNQER